MFTSIPVIRAFRAAGSSGERIKLLEIGADDFILKPFNPQELKISSS